MQGCEQGKPSISRPNCFGIISVAIVDLFDVFGSDQAYLQKAT